MLCDNNREKFQANNPICSNFLKIYKKKVCHKKSQSKQKKTFKTIKTVALKCSSVDFSLYCIFCLLNKTCSTADNKIWIKYRGWKIKVEYTVVRSQKSVNDCVMWRSGIYNCVNWMADEYLKQKQFVGIDQWVIAR